MAEENTAVNKLKALLGITEEDKDILLEFALENAKETVKNYCHIEEIPEGLSTTVYRMAADIYRNEQMGSAEVPHAVASVTVGDTSTSFATSNTEFSESILKDYKAALNRYRRVVFQ